MEKEELLSKLRTCAAKDTSADPGGWTVDNPLWGHCAVASLLAQEVFGGELVRGSLKDVEKYAHLRSHYWNRLPDGQEFDFTSEQYPDVSCKDLVGEIRSRESVLEHPDTQTRFAVFKERFNQACVDRRSSGPL
ncbi:hypothetical protein FJY94_00730 [Candidatus Kaiserbacteria bacterium]|nr:hypothetical protein [Candidatus Kaiserbacteria bacterium]